MSANRHWLTNVGKLMSAVPSHDFETRRSCSNEIAASNVTHSHRKRSGGHYQEKEKGEVHAHCIGVHIVGKESATRRWRLRPTSPSSSSSSLSLSDRRFRSLAIPTSTSGSPSPSHGITPVYLHHLPPSNRVLSLPESSSSPPQGNSEIHEREPDLPQGVLVSESTTKSRDETSLHRNAQERRNVLFYNGKFGKNNCQGGCSSSGTPLVKDSHRLWLWVANWSDKSWGFRLVSECTGDRKSVV